MDLAGLAELCANVARHSSADIKQSDTAHALHVEWIQLGLKRLLDGGHREPKKSLKKRMAEFLVEIPKWMLTGS